MSSFVLDREEIKAGIKPEIMDFLFGSNYDELSEIAADLVKEGRSEARYLPAVRLIVGSALRVLELPEVAGRLPQEIAARRNAALHAAECATNLALATDTLTQYYVDNPFLMNLTVKSGEEGALRNKEYLLSLGQSPFFDVAGVSGAALNLIRERDVSGSPPDIIARSTGLLAISGVYKGDSDVAVDYLGLPYASTEHLGLQEGIDGPEVDFTAEAKDFLGNLHVQGRGCPAGKVTEQGADHSLLEEYWRKLVYYLVPENATAEWQSG